MNERLLVGNHLAGRLETADRFGIVEELRLGHQVAAHEIPPPCGPRFPLVIFQQLAGKPSDRTGFLAFYQALPQRVAFTVILLRLLLRCDDARPRFVRGMVLDKPVPQRKRRAAVFLVVVGDRRKQCRILGLDPLLIRQNGVHPAPDVGPSRERRECFDFFQRVTVDAGPKALAHHRVQIDEDVSPQQLVYLVFARGVGAHELFERRVLVGTVVIHMHLRIGSQSCVHQIDELLRTWPARRGGRAPRWEDSASRHPPSAEARRGSAGPVRAPRTDRLRCRRSHLHSRAAAGAQSRGPRRTRSRANPVVRCVRLSTWSAAWSRKVSKEWRAIRGTSVSAAARASAVIVGNPPSRSRTTCSRRTPATCTR